MGLDILTPKGQKSVKYEDCAVEIWNKHYPDIEYCRTPKDSPATVDAILNLSSVVCGVVEQKSRDMTYSKLKSYDFEWLVTYEKIEKAQKISSGLCVPLFGFLYLIPERFLLWKELVNENGEWVTEYKVRNTETQETINGGLIYRDNAYIKMDDAEILR